MTFVQCVFNKTAIVRSWLVGVYGSPFSMIVDEHLKFCKMLRTIVCLGICPRQFEMLKRT